MRILALAALALCAQPAFASEWVLVEGQGVKPATDAAVRYLDLASVKDVDGGKEIEIASLVHAVQADERPSAFAQRFRIDCAWQTSSAGPTRNLGPAGAVPATPPPETWKPAVFSYLPGVQAAVAIVCDEAAPPAERLPSEDAMLTDGARRLGYADAATAFGLPIKMYIRQAPSYRSAPAHDDKNPMPQNLVLASDDGRALFIMPQTTSRNGPIVYGHSTWLAGAGMAGQPRSYAYRAFEADCDRQAIAFSTFAVWPVEGYQKLPKPGERPAVTSQRRAPPPSTPAAAALQAACTGTEPLKRLASVRELLAYASNPGEDPAFLARRQVTFTHDAMRWQSVPTAEELTAALPAGALKPGEKGETVLQCGVTRDYKLSGCTVSYRSPWDRKLEDVHMQFVDRYVPARQTIDGRDTAGHTVEARVAWTAERSSPAPVTLRFDHMRWRGLPTTGDIKKAYRLNKPAEAWMECTITQALRLANCRVPSIGSSGVSIANALTGRKDRDEVYETNKAFGQAMLTLVGKYEAEAITIMGEATAGQKVHIFARWPVR